MRSQGASRFAVAGVAVLLGCGGGRPLDPAPGTSGAAGGGQTAGSTGSAPSAGRPTMPGGVVTPRPPECGCTPGAGIDLLACGNDFPTHTGRDAPEAVVTPDGATVVFNRCLPLADGSCTSGIFQWKSGEGTRKLTELAWAFAVSADGTTVLGDRYADVVGPFLLQGNGSAEIWLPLPGAYVHLLSADGSIVVARVETGVGTTEAVRWTAAGGPVALGDLPGGPIYSEPTAINADASVIVGYGNTAAGQEPFLWTRSAGMIGLGSLPSPIEQTVARATNADGTVVVGSNLTDGGTAIFRWTASGGITGIGYMFANVPLGGPMSYFSIWSPPLLVSADGGVVTGTAPQRSNPMAPFAFRWTASAGLEPLSSAPASIVRAASADGRRIAGSTLASGAPPGMPFAPLPYQAFLFEEGKGTRALADVLAGVDLGGMTFGDPIALSADGGTLVGHATCAGAPAIYRAVLPR